MLARDAAEILWEMVALGEGGAAAEDMKAKAHQLQAQVGPAGRSAWLPACKAARGWSGPGCVQG